MKPELRRFGESQSPVVVIDDFSGSAENIARLGDVLAPFPALQGNYYPGVRRVIAETDADAYSYVLDTCRQAAPFIGGAFEVEGFDLVEGSFSLVTVQPHALRPVQRAPHFDSTDQNYFALLHYLRVPPGSGTAFYRQRSTGIERVTEQNLATFVRAAEAIEPLLPRDSGYIQGSNPHYEQIGAIEAVPDRMIIYQGSLLHSGIIPPDMKFSADPREGRLTANLFVRGR
ncbi:MAG TPA: DUF6445 family protein [Sphingomicrobium sp.]|nr:DUF6445 family protein [Sphingomicrobium sp.]